MEDSALMNKHRLSAQGLQSVFDKMVKAGVISRQELDERVPVSERTVELGLFVCPACGNIQGKEFTECSRCGFTLPRYVKDRQDEAAQEKKDQAEKTAVTQVLKYKKGPRARSAASVSPGEASDVSTAGALAPELTRIALYCRLLGIAGLTCYVLVAVAMLTLIPGSHPAGGLSTPQLLLGLVVVALPAVVIAFMVFVVLRALAISLQVFSSVSGAPQKIE